MKNMSKILWAAIGAGATIGVGVLAMKRHPNQPLGPSLRAAGRELLDLAAPLLQEAAAAQKQARHTARDLGEHAQQRAHQAIDALDRSFVEAQDVIEDKAADAREALGHTAKVVQEKAGHTVHAMQEKAEDTVHAWQETAHTVQDSAHTVQDSAKDTLLAAKDQASVRMHAIIEPIVETGSALKKQLKDKLGA